MRKLGLADAFSMARIIKAAEVKDEIIAFASEVQARTKSGEAVNVESIGFEFMLTLISAAANEKVEKEIYKLYASLKGCKPDDVKMLGLSEIRADIAELIKKNDLKNFFHLASRLISKAQDF